MDGTEILDIPLPDDDAFTKFILHYKQFMALYESAIRCVAMRLDIMEKEADTDGTHNPIRSISSRIKQPLSIDRKLRNRGMPLTTKSIMENLHDVAEVRICFLKQIPKCRKLQNSVIYLKIDTDTSRPRSSPTSLTWSRAGKVMP